MSDTTMALDASGAGRFRRSLTRRDWRSLDGMVGFIVLLHVVGFSILFGFVIPVGVGILAYTFGLKSS